MLHHGVLLTLFRLGMSELLINLAAGFSAAAEASRRLQAYVEDIDKYLGMQQTRVSPDKINTDDDIASQEPIDQTIPWDLLHNLPWDSPEWDITELAQLP